MAEQLAKHRCFTTIHKHYSLQEWIEFADRCGRDPAVCRRASKTNSSARLVHKFWTQRDRRARARIAYLARLVRLFSLVDLQSYRR